MFLKNFGYHIEASTAIPKALETVRGTIGKMLPHVQNSIYGMSSVPRQIRNILRNPVLFCCCFVFLYFGGVGV